MKDSERNIESLTTGFFTNSLNETELAKLSEWLNENTSHLEEFSRLRSSWILAGHETGKENFSAPAGWLKMQQCMDAGRKAGKKPQVKKLPPLWYAASLLACFFLGAATVILLPQRQSELPAAIAMNTIKVPLGSKSHITLPDGSSVWLNAGSVLTYSSDFGTKQRELQLAGEGFFDVESDSLKPFYVHTSGMTVRALGTRFNVKAYPDDCTMAATLEEGIIDVTVQASSGGKEYTQSAKLKPKEQLVIQKVSAENAPAVEKRPQQTASRTAPSVPAIKEMVIKPDVKTELSTSWKDDKWIIDDEPLSLFVTDMERRYNLNIHFASEELKEYKFTGTFENETVEQILTAISFAAPVSYRFNKNNVVLSLNTRDKDKFSKVLKNKQIMLNP